MHLGLCITLLAFLAVHDCWAQNLAAIDRLIDSVANPPLDRNEALRFEREEIDGIRLSETDAVNSGFATKGPNRSSLPM